MNILIDTESPIPVYQQIKNQLKGMIISKELSKGVKIPSIRNLASMLGVSINTVARAYYELEKEGFLKLDGRRGSEIINNPEPNENQKKEFLIKLTEEYLLRTKEFLYTKEEILKIVKEKYDEIYY